ncbi:hypothetical protein [Salisediminibacterium beveridgei]|nr:hypothetical protein [Salisediminibacterium beveridgei]
MKKAAIVVQLVMVPVYLTGLAVGFILVGEFAGRYLFYLSGIPMNIG